MEELLQECRERIGLTPRCFRASDRRYLEPPAPGHVRRDPLRMVYHDRRHLLERGDVVWARLVQANEALFQPGREDLPAVATFSLDPFFDAQPDALGQLACNLFALKGTQPQDPEKKAFARAITDERERVFNRVLPPSLSNRHEVFYTTIMVMRSHLPYGRLHSGLFPLLVLPSETPAACILPSRFWAPALIYAWQMMRESNL